MLKVLLATTLGGVLVRTLFDIRDRRLNLALAVLTGHRVCAAQVVLMGVTNDIARVAIEASLILELIEPDVVIRGKGTEEFPRHLLVTSRLET